MQGELAYLHARGPSSRRPVKPSQHSQEGQRRRISYRIAAGTVRLAYGALKGE